MSLRVKKGDKVKVLAGKDKGKTGKVLKILPEKKRLVVEGINLVKKHFRRRAENEPGGLKEVPAALHISNVALMCPSCDRSVRFRIKTEESNKMRICKQCEQAI